MGFQIGSVLPCETLFHCVCIENCFLILDGSPKNLNNLDFAKGDSEGDK